MANKDSPMELYEISTESEGSDSDSDWEDSGEDSDYESLEESHSKFSNLSLKHKAKARFIEEKDRGEEELVVTASVNDGENFGKVQKLIEEGLLEKLKVDECKLYLRKNGLRLTGNKDTLIERIREHLEILNGGEKKYPPSSFVLNCKGDACTGDVVLFEQNVYEMFNIASRSASGQPCGKRIVAGRIVKESYGAAKQQHTFTIEVLWSKGEKPLPPLYPLLIKGRNLYRLKTLRQKWEDEAERKKILMEKHSRGSLARAYREERIQEKEKRKNIKENRISKIEARNQRQSNSHITRPQYQPQGTNVVINPENPEFPSRNSDLSVNIMKERYCILNNPAATFGGTSFGVQSMHRNHTSDFRNTFDIGRVRGAETGANYYADPHFRENLPRFVNCHPNMAEMGTHHRIPLANANHSHPFMVPNRESFKINQVCKHYPRGRCYFGDNCKFIHDLRDKGNA
ncbi:zinc finger CCCH domain-containing protein 62 [Vigna radiata var. radiata]|uniref:Zinc finger CCCH domain-containing protein 62 n=1 Tax=Vigna radiata var. radiata TaxID=3916 RepID=A0A1S3VCJ7_VIGRR|nr:zinc finger CCCH domain-containing protein 62 [Vigna radiata var. radiata]